MTTWNLILLLLLELMHCDAFVDRCNGGEQIFRSSDSTHPGTFSSPGWPKHYPEHLRCRYTFIAGPREKVRIDFLAFNVEGLGPLCEKDFVDIYVQLESAESKLDASPLLGRYCGHSLAAVPSSVVSIDQILVIDFYSDKNTQRVYNNDMHMQSLGFFANYTFVPVDDYELGSPLIVTNNSKHFIFLSNSRQEAGTLLSPTYPGLYPNNLNYTYVFKGQPGTRVKLQFEELDIYEISDESIEQRERIESCPVDVVRFFDSEIPERQIQDDFCGTRHGLTIVSSENNLRMEFLTGVGRIARTRGIESDSGWREIHRRGFRLRYQVAHTLLQLKQSLLSHHISGTECDFIIRSNGRSKGSFQFPGLRASTSCRLFFQGIHNRQRTEALQLLLPSDLMPASDFGNACSTGALSVFAKGQRMDTQADQVFCVQQQRTVQKPVRIRSTGPQLFLRMDAANQVPSNHFDIQYEFVTDYGIPGEPLEKDKCEFVYRSSELVGAKGFTNSPLFNIRSKTHYPHNVTCTYRFISDQDNLSIRIRFTHFYVEDYFIESLNNDKRHHSTGSYVACTGDRVELYERYAAAGSVDQQQLDLLAVYCGTSIPGPYVSHPDASEVIVKFMSTWDRSPHAVYGQRTATGFQIQYDFPVKVDVFHNDVCGGNISSDSHGGVIQMPKNPNMKYSPDLVCEWHIHPSKPGNEIFVQFPEFHLEGSTKSCSMAVVRIYRGDSHIPASEICGADNSIPAFYSEGSQHIRIRLITTAGSRGGKGLKFSWTEILHTESGRCTGFRCRKTKHCIDHRLECNHLPNCGSFVQSDINSFDPIFNRSRSYSEYTRDTSDEEVNCPTEATYQLFHVGIGVGITAALILLLLLLVLCNRRSKLMKAQSLLDLSASRRLVSESSDFCRGGGGGGGGGDGVGSCSRQRGGDYGETSTLTREKMQKISIV